MLPSRALQLISEYSKPITRPDWRTCKRITQKDASNHIRMLDKSPKTRQLYRLVHRNMYDYLFEMKRKDLIDLIIYQDSKTKYIHKVDELNNSTMRQLVLTEIFQEKKMKQHEEILKQRKINNILKEKKRLRHRKINYF
jgi:hypothetical protein